MNILIKGMEMPVTCCHCPLMGYDPDIGWNDGGRETQGAYICVLTHELIDNTKREDHCPLIPVQPHGRLGDLDALECALKVKEAQRQWHDSFSAIFDGDPYYEGVFDAKTEFKELVGSAPTIIPASEEGET